jgi:mRNA interferase MazF
MVTSRFDVYLIGLEPEGQLKQARPRSSPPGEVDDLVVHVSEKRAKGHEIKKTRPCVVVSPDEINRHIGTVIVAPMTTKGRPYPTRVPVHFGQKDGLVVLDQIRAVDKDRLVKKLGRLDEDTGQAVLKVLIEMFAE